MTNASVAGGLGGGSLLLNDFLSLGGEDGTTMRLAAVAIAVILASLLWRRAQDPVRLLKGVPRAHSWIPFLGLGPAYFSGPLPFSKRMQEKYGSTFMCTVFGRTWLFCNERTDVVALLKAPEKQVSMLRAADNLAGFTFPQDKLSDYPTPELLQAIAWRRGRGPGNTFAIIHSIRKDKRLAWIPPLRALLSDTFARLPKEGTVSLFDWCQDLITTITVRVLLGDAVGTDEGLLEEFVALFNEGDPEAGFKGPLTSFGTLLETTVLGERRVFARVRALLDPYIESELERLCVEKDKIPKEDASESVLQSFVRSWHARLGYDATKTRLAKRRILNETFLFTFAAFTNSYAGAAWLIYHVLRNTQGVGDNILKEIADLQAQFGKNGTLSESEQDLNCPWLEYTLLEISRLYTPGNLVREIAAPFTLPSLGQEIPVGTLVNFSVGLAHRNPAVFSDPLHFDPSRHTPESKQKNAYYQLYTFGAGAHPCPGRKFAVYEMALFVAEALQQFDLTLHHDGAPAPTDAFTKSFMGEEDPYHPRVDPAQIGFIWRSLDPVMVKYQRKSSH